MPEKDTLGPAWLHAAFLTSTIEGIVRKALPTIDQLFTQHGVQLTNYLVETGWDTPDTGVHVAIRVKAAFNDVTEVLTVKIPAEEFGDNTCVSRAIKRLCKEELPLFVGRHVNG
jgi:hypothetical protein